MAELDAIERDCPVVIIGDSRIEGGPFDDQGLGWCNYGIRGDVSYGVRDRLPSVIAKAPEVVVIQVGRNDFAVDGRDVRTTFLNYKAIIDILLTDGFKVVVTSTLPDDARAPATNSMIHKLNMLLEEYCEVTEAVYMDLGGLLAPNGYLIYTDDGVHPNAEGYLIFKGAVQWYLVTI
jgi:lysophospholipase L1-like esterase